MPTTLLLSLLSPAPPAGSFEYALHGWGGHLARGRTFFSREHLAHHANPGYFTPTPLKLATAAPFLIALGAAAVWLAGAFAGARLHGEPRRPLDALRARAPPHPHPSAHQRLLAVAAPQPHPPPLPRAA
ncbi:MAG: hypothetical protein IPK07_24510 [Deltaproteobacteria bacterium]|nr:hypothetical protein [Deltaproteobacteria bacterium]